MYQPFRKASMACLLCLILLCPSLVQAQIPTPLPHTYVNDLARVLTRDDIAALNAQIHALEKTWSVQLAIVLVRRLPDSMDIADYAGAIGRKWHAGINDSGLVYVASINQRKQRLEVARALEGIITDISASAITDDIKPFFRNKDYAGGLMHMISAIDSSLHQAQAAQDQAGQAPAHETPANFQNVDTNDQGIPWPFFIFGSFVLGVFIIILRGIFSGRARRRPQYYSGAGMYVDNNVYMGSAGYDPSINGSTNNIVDSGSSDFGSPSSSDSGFSDSSSSSDPGFSSSDAGFSGGGASNDW